MSPKSLLLACALVSLVTPAAFAQPVSDEAAIRAALTQWRDDFNAGRTERVCDIFAPELQADNKGAGERGFDAQCKLLHNVLADPARAFSYALDIQDIFAAGDMAAVRLVWTLTTRDKASGRLSTTEEQGLDLFGRDGDGHWRIVRFMTYERP